MDGNVGSGRTRGADVVSLERLLGNGGSVAGGDGTSCEVVSLVDGGGDFLGLESSFMIVQGCSDVGLIGVFFLDGRGSGFNL